MIWALFATGTRVGVPEICFQDSASGINALEGLEQVHHSGRGGLRIQARQVLRTRKLLRGRESGVSDEDLGEPKPSGMAPF
jgi:hypothetical protein